MEKDEIIKLFLENGFQVSKKALSNISSDPEKIIAGLKEIKPRPYIVTEEHIEKILKEEKLGGEKPSLETIREYRATGGPIKIPNCTSHFISCYKKIRKILSERLMSGNLISINKITPRVSEFTIIGMVREKKDNKLLVEDLTGEAHVFFKNDTKKKLGRISLDDVIGLRCENEDGRNYVKKVIYPDVLSSRKINRLKKDTQIALLSNLSRLENKDYMKALDILSEIDNLGCVFLFLDKKNDKILSDFSKFRTRLITEDSNSVLYGLDTIKILTLPRKFLNPSEKKPIDSMVSLLKRRYLSPVPEHPIKTERFVLEKAPDIMLSDLGEGNSKNYKGTTLISNSSPNKIFFVNLKSREVRKITI